MARLDISVLEKDLRLNKRGGQIYRTTGKTEEQVLFSPKSPFELSAGQQSWDNLI